MNWNLEVFNWSLQNHSFAQKNEKQWSGMMTSEAWIWNILDHGLHTMESIDKCWWLKTHYNVVENRCWWLKTHYKLYVENRVIMPNLWLWRLMAKMIGSWVPYHAVQMDRLKDLGTRCKNSESKRSHDFLLMKNRIQRNPYWRIVSGWKTLAHDAKTDIPGWNTFAHDAEIEH